MAEPEAMVDTEDMAELEAMVESEDMVEQEDTVEPEDMAGIESRRRFGGAIRWMLKKDKD